MAHQQGRGEHAAADLIARFPLAAFARCPLAAFGPSDRLAHPELDPPLPKVTVVGEAL